MPNLNPTLSSKQAVLIVTFLAISFLSYCTYGVYRTWYPGPASTDITEYPEMRERFKEIYPWAPDFLPDSIPPNATNIFYSAFPYSVMQGRPMLDLSFTLNPEDAQIELERLRSFNPDTEIDTDFKHYFNFYGGQRSRFAYCTYDARTHEFSYMLSSD